MIMRSQRSPGTRTERLLVALLILVSEGIEEDLSIRSFVFACASPLINQSEDERKQDFEILEKRNMGT